MGGKLGCFGGPPRYGGILGGGGVYWGPPEMESSLGTMCDRKVPKRRSVKPTGCLRSTS